MKMTNKEIEIQLSYKDKSRVISILKKQKAKRVDEFVLVDKYYGINNVDMNNKKNPLLRIRKKGKNAEFTYKGIIESKDDIWERTELNVKINDPEILEKILIALEYKIVSYNESTREVWSLKRTKLFFTKFVKPAVFEFLEIEGKTRKDIDDILKILGPEVKALDKNSFSKLDSARNKKSN